VLVGSQGVAWIFDPATGDVVDRLESPDAADGWDAFGESVAAAGASFAIGAPGSGQRDGAVHIFDTSTRRLRRTLRQPGVESFGSAVAMGGRRLLVTASEGSTTTCEYGRGHAFVFDAETGDQLAATSVCEDSWGAPAALVRDAAAVGFRVNDSMDAGFVHLFPVR